MRTTRTTPRRLVTALLAAPLLLAAATTAEAGPPAVCHPLATRGEVPIHAGPDGWGDVATGLSGEEAIKLALDALGRSDESLLHMETLRRCVIAITGVGPRKDVSKREQRRLAAMLLTGLRARVGETSEACAPSCSPEPQLANAHRTAQRRAGRARFNLGYAAAALRQVGVESDVEIETEIASGLQACDTDGAMFLGAALAIWKEEGDAALYRRLSAALDRAEDDDVLAANLVSTAEHFFECRTLSDLRMRVKKELEKGC